MRQGIQIPDVLITPFQQFGSVYEDPFDSQMSGGGMQKSVTLKTYKQIENTMKNFILARFMIYKWLGPFNEMYIKLQQ